MSTERSYFICPGEPGTQPEYICVSPRERYIELVDESRPKDLISRLPYWNHAECLLAYIYSPISRERYLDARLKVISKFPAKRRAEA